MKVYAFDSADWAEAERNGLSKLTILSVVTNGAQAMAALLPTLSEYLNIVVRPNERGIIPEYGCGGYTEDSEFIEIVFDKTAAAGVDTILHSLHVTPFHEGNHAARYNYVAYDPSFLHSTVFEGLATRFEREFGKHDPLYGKYENDETMRAWFEELSTKDWSDRSDYMFRHPDGRRWIGYKVGTWLVDRAIKHSGKSVVELTTIPAAKIIELARAS